MNISINGINLIKAFEGCRLQAYKCVSTEKYYTIGYGHYGADVKPNMVITQAEADRLFLIDVQKFVDRVNKYQSKYNFNQNQFDALCSFCYNLGSIDQLTGNGTKSIQQIANDMLLYVNSGGKRLQGLVNRRKRERELFDLPTGNVETVVTVNPEPSNNSVYYNGYCGSEEHLDAILRAIGVDEKYIGNWMKRIPVAKKNGIQNYTGSYSQNMRLKQLAKEGRLIRV